jgi:hypothetical protein
MAISSFAHPANGGPMTKANVTRRLHKALADAGASCSTCLMRLPVSLEIGRVAEVYSAYRKPVSVRASCFAETPGLSAHGVFVATAWERL